MLKQVKLHDKLMSQIELFGSGRGYYCGNIRILWKYPRSVDIICILRKYACSVHIFRVSLIYLHSVDIIRISWIYPHSVDIICILCLYPHFVNTIGIVHIVRYLAQNVHYVLHIFVLVVGIIFGCITSYLACNVYPFSHILFIW